MPPYSNGDSLFIGRHYRPQQRVFATLDPLTASANVTLSADLLTITRNAPGGAWANAKSTIAQTTGRWFFEVTYLGPAATNGNLLGTTGAALPSNSFPGVTAPNGQGYQSQPAPASSLSWPGPAAIGVGPPFEWVVGDVIGVAVDADVNSVFTILNGAVTVPDYLIGNTPNPVFACLAVFHTGCSMRVNFGASPLAFPASVPVGYNAGWWV